MEKIIEVLQTKRLNKFEIEQMADYVSCDKERIDILIQQAKSEEYPLSWHAWWLCDHIAKQSSSIFEKYREEIITLLLHCHHEGKKRLMLNVLMNTNSNDEISVPLLNFCFDNMLSPNVPVAVQSNCMKLAYQLCMKEPELLPELKSILESADTSFLTPATQSTIKKILTGIKKRK